MRGRWPTTSWGASRSARSEPELLQTVSRWELIGLSINDVVGSGVYLLPAAAAALLGAWSTAGVALAGLAIGLLVLCFCEASSYFDEPGGAYLYTREAFGRFVGFEVGWMTWLARVASVASLTNGFTLATAFVWPAASSGWPRIVLITGTLVLLTWINIVGVEAGARAAVALTIGKALPLLLFVAIGVFQTDWSALVPRGQPPMESLGQAGLLLLFAYAGFENTPAAAGEYRDPKRDVPIALIVATLFIITLYCSVQAVSLGTVPRLGEAEAPVAEAATRIFGGWGGMLMTVGAMISILGNVSNTTLMGPRYLYALALDGFGPRALARVHLRYRTPVVAIASQSALALGLALSWSFVQLAMLSVAARLVTYLGTALAMPILRRRFGDRKDAFLLPGGGLIPVGAVLLSLIFLASATPGNLRAGAMALVVGALIYGLGARADGGPVPR